MFDPKDFTYPAGGSKHDILVSGVLTDEDGDTTLSNITITDQNIAKELRTAENEFNSEKEQAEEALREAQEEARKLMQEADKVNTQRQTAARAKRDEVRKRLKPAILDAAKDTYADRQKAKNEEE